MFSPRTRAHLATARAQRLSCLRFQCLSRELPTEIAHQSSTATARYSLQQFVVGVLHGGEHTTGSSHDTLFLSLSLQFAEQEKLLDLLRFWLAVEHFYQSTINRMIDHATLQENAIAIYDQYGRASPSRIRRLSVLHRFISLQAPARLGFDDAIRARIECSICQQDADAGPSADTFDQTAWITYNILQRVNYMGLLSSCGVDERILGILPAICAKSGLLPTHP